MTTSKKCKLCENLRPKSKFFRVDDRFCLDAKYRHLKDVCSKCYQKVTYGNKLPLKDSSY